MNLPTRALPLLALLTTAPLVAQELRHVGFRGFGGGVYDPVRERVIIPDVFGYSLEWDGVSWHRAPDAGAVSGFCYLDASQDRLVTVREEGWGFGEVFQFHQRTGHEWQPMPMSGGPTDRWGMTVAYDEQRQELVAFGGFDGSLGILLGGTWTFDGTAWQQHTVVEPSPRYFATACYDSTRQRVVLFGGNASVVLADTWEWDGAAWSQMTPAVSPSARALAGMTFDSGRGVVVMAGGGDTSPTPLAEVWEYDGLNWQQQASPPTPVGARFDQVIYDEARAETLLLGWDDGGLSHGSVLAWDGTQWSTRPGLGARAPQSNLASASADHTGAFVLRQGGYYNGSSVPMRLLGWDGNDWTTLSTGGPSGRFASRIWPMATATYLFGGFDAGGALSDTWRWDGVSWSQLSPAVSPPARALSAVAFHASQGHALLFGGTSSTTQYGAMGGTWKFDGTTWQELSGGLQPGARRGHAMAYDPIRDRIVMCGGEIVSQFPGGSTVYDDTWEHDGTSWTRALTNGGPTQNTDGPVSIAYDASSQRIVAVTRNWPSYSLWEYDGVSWSQMSVAGDKFSAHPLSAYEPQICPGPNGNLAVVDLGFVMELLPNPSSAEPYGSACTSSAPNLLAATLPDLGQTSFALETTLAPANGLVAIAGAHQMANVSVLGCTLLVQPLTTSLFIADAQGYARQPLPLPANPALLGGEFYFQAAVLDGTVPSGISLSRGLRITLGE